MASAAALAQMRTYLDKLPLRTVIIGTTNKTIAELPEQLQSRFKILYFDPVPMAVIAAWLLERFPKLGAAMAGSIAIQSAGNVRAAETVAASIADNWVGTAANEGGEA